MKALAVYRKQNQPHGLREITMDRPQSGPRDLLVKILAIGINPVDYKQRQWQEQHAPAGEPRILGWDASGTVEAVGEKVRNYTPGQQVYYAGDITREGCYAEYHVVDERLVSKKPQTLSHVQAAAVPLTALTAWESIFELLDINPTEDHLDVLIIGGAGGVGSIATQLLSKLTKTRIIATASRPETHQWCKQMGAHIIVNHYDLVRSMQEQGIEQVDYVLNTAQIDPHWSAITTLLKPFGKVCSITKNASPLDLDLFRDKSLTLAYEFMFTRSMFRTPDMHEQGRILQEVSQLLDQEMIHTTLNRTLKGLSVKNILTAHEILQAGTAIGKIAIAL